MCAHRHGILTHRHASETQGVVERSYNVFPVYLKGQTPDAYTGVGPRPDPCETVIAVDTSDDSKGEMCIEMWIRHVNDGVMSRMLRRVAKVRREGMIWQILTVRVKKRATGRLRVVTNSSLSLLNGNSPRISAGKLGWFY